jgi:hypothetical protein
MDDDCISAVEGEQLVLAPALDAIDALPFRAPRTRRWQLPLQRGMDGAHGSDRLSKRGTAEKAGRRLYFRKLGQARSSLYRFFPRVVAGVANRATMGPERVKHSIPENFRTS